MSRSLASQDIQRLEQLKKRFVNWRRTRKAKTAIPSRLWNSAAKMAMHCGLSRTAKALGLNYYDLKKRIDACAAALSSSATFIELSPAVVGSMPEYIIECEDENGAKMRIQIKGANAPDLNAIAATFWRGGR
jgi:hypothetical protein